MNSWPRSLCVRHSVKNGRNPHLRKNFHRFSRPASSARVCAAGVCIGTPSLSALPPLAPATIFGRGYESLRAFVDTHACGNPETRPPISPTPRHVAPFLFYETSDKRPRARFSGSFVTPADSAPISSFMPLSLAMAQPQRCRMSFYCSNIFIKFDLVLSRMDTLQILSFLDFFF